MQAPHTIAAGVPMRVTITELVTVSPNRFFVGKKIFTDGSIDGAPNIKTWKAWQRSVANIEELFSYVKRMQSRGDACIIRGLGEHQPGERVLRRIDQFGDVPQAWAAFDIDGVELLPGDDWMQDAKAAADSIVQMLIGEDASYVCALTGTHGLEIDEQTGRWTGGFVPWKMRFRLLVMLDRATSNAELKTWTINLKLIVPQIDPGLANSPVQPIYTARPLNVADRNVNVLARTGVPTCWLVKRERDYLAVPHDLTRQTVLERASGISGIFGSHPDVESAIRAIGTPAKNGNCVYAHLMSAVSLLAATNPWDGQTPIADYGYMIRDTTEELIRNFQTEIFENMVSVAMESEGGTSVCEPR